MKALDKFTLEDLKRNQARLKKKALAFSPNPVAGSDFLQTLSDRDLLIAMAIKTWPYRENVKTCFENAYAHFEEGRAELIRAIAKA